MLKKILTEDHCGNVEKFMRIPSLIQLYLSDEPSQTPPNTERRNKLVSKSCNSFGGSQHFATMNLVRCRKYCRINFNLIFVAILLGFTFKLWVNAISSGSQQAFNGQFFISSHFCFSWNNWEISEDWTNLWTSNYCCFYSPSSPDSNFLCRGKVEMK